MEETRVYCAALANRPEIKALRGIDHRTRSSLLLYDPRYAQNDLRQDLWRAGHAHAGVLLILSLVALRYVSVRDS